MTSPPCDFFTVFDFSGRQFDACFEMGDSADVVRSLIGLCGNPMADKKFAEAGWTEEYLLSRGHLDASDVEVEVQRVMNLSEQRLRDLMDLFPSGVALAGLDGTLMARWRW